MPDLSALSSLILDSGAPDIIGFSDCVVLVQ
jgi:hypothetical protein